MSEVLEPKDVRKFQQVVDVAIETNQEPIEVMARWGMLRREAQDGHQALVRMYRSLEAVDIANIMQFYLGRGGGTAADGFRAVMLWMEQYIDAREVR